MICIICLKCKDSRAEAMANPIRSENLKNNSLIQQSNDVGEQSSIQETINNLEQRLNELRSSTGTSSARSQENHTGSEGLLKNLLSSSGNALSSSLSTGGKEEVAKVLRELSVEDENSKNSIGLSK